MTGATVAGHNLRDGQQPKENPVDAANPNGGVGSRRTASQVLKDIGLFFAAPFVTLAYLAMFPFIGIRMVLEARRQRKEAG